MGTEWLTIEKIRQRMASVGVRSDLSKTVMVMLYELGDLAKGLVYSGRADPEVGVDDRPAYIAEAKVAMADLLMQCRLIAHEFGWGTAELFEMGEERLLHRMDEVEKREIR